MRNNKLAFVLAAAIGVGSVQVATAADMAVKARPSAPVAVYNWTGCYIGAHAGGDWTTSHWTYTNINPYSAIAPGGPIDGTDNNFNMSSWTAGGQVGCNYQFDRNWVVGIEGSWSGTDLSQTVNNVVQVFAPTNTQTVRTHISSIATATARIGYSFAPPWLVYAKGGYAGAKVETSGRTTPAVAGLVLDWDTSKWQNGWTVGGGVEYRLWQNVTLGVEYGFIRLSSAEHTGAVSGGAITAANQIVHNVTADIHMVTARVNYLFNPGF